MIQPVNGHLLIEPIKHESFMSSQKEVYEEVGLVLDAGESDLKKGTKVFFDSWLAARYPNFNGDGFIWLVDIDDIRAIDDGDK